MATATTPRNRERVWQKIIETLAATGTGQPGNKRSPQKLCWVSAGVPSSTAPDDMLAGQFILDTTNGDVYVFEGSTTYTNITG